MEAMRNRPEIRKKMLEMQQGRGKESKEERRAKKREEKEVSHSRAITTRPDTLWNVN